MDFLLLGRVAKGAALLGFVLPWVTVSCSGTEILSATGVQLMSGDPQPAGPLAGQDMNNEDTEPAVLVIAACVLLALGLVASFFTKGRVAATVLIIGGLGGAGLTYYSVENMQGELTRQISENQDTGGLLSARDARQMSEAVAGAIRVEKEEGYWLTLGAALLAALLGLLAIASVRRREAPDPPV